MICLLWDNEWNGNYLLCLQGLHTKFPLPPKLWEMLINSDSPSLPSKFESYPMKLFVNLFSFLVPLSFSVNDVNRCHVRSFRGRLCVSLGQSQSPTVKHLKGSFPWLIFALLKSLCICISLYLGTLDRYFCLIECADREGKRFFCIDRESNPELGHGKTQCYRYTINAYRVLYNIEILSTWKMKYIMV